MTVGEQANLSSLRTKRPECRHQPLQDPPYSLCVVSIVSSGMQQEHHIHRAMRTHWLLCDRDLRTSDTPLDRYQREDIGNTRV